MTMISYTSYLGGLFQFQCNLEDHHVQCCGHTEMMIYIADYLDANDTNGGTAFETAIGVQAKVIDGGTAFETAIGNTRKLSECLLYKRWHMHRQP